MTTSGDVDQFLQVDPLKLTFAKNVRSDRVNDAGFKASIRELGVMETITCYRGDNDELVVYRGNQRAWTAADLKHEHDDLTWSTVPVRVIPRPADEVERIVHQYSENKWRTEMSVRDDANAVEQLALLGLKPADITKKLGVKAKDQTAHRAVAQSELASEASVRWNLTLEQAAAIADFDDDKAAVTALAQGIKEGRFTHVHQRLVEAREERRYRNEKADELQAQGITGLREEPDDPALELRVLRITPDEHRDCSGHAGLAVRRYRWEGGKSITEWQTDWYCMDPAAHGHELPEWMRPKDQGPEETPEEAAKRKATETAQRRVVIANNKAWALATEKRREFLFTLVARKTPPAGAELFIYQEMLRLPHQLRNALDHYVKGAAHQAFRDIMGLDRDAPSSQNVLTNKVAEQELAELLTASATLTPKRATLLTAAMVLAAWHFHAGPNTWRSPSDTDTRMLLQLQSWGYALSEVEELALTTYDETQAKAAESQAKSAAAGNAESDLDEGDFDEGDFDEGDFDDEDFESDEFDAEGMLPNDMKDD